MSNLAICKRYAGALHAEAEAGDIVAQIDDDVALCRQSVDESNDLQQLFASPVIRTRARRACIEQLFADNVSDLFLRFILLLNEKGRVDMIGEVLAAYKMLRNEQLGIVEAESRSAMKLAESEVEALQVRLSATTGSDVRLTTEEDATLLGGVVVRIGDTVYDGSLRRRLSMLRTQLEGGSHLRN